MSKRNEHTFQFTAQQIRAAARAEAEYHEARIEHWQERADAAITVVEATIFAKVVERQTSMGSHYDVVVDYGDLDAWQEYNLATSKVRTHREAAERFRTDERVYGSQVDDRIIAKTYDLDVDDVHHFRLGGQPRED